ncbi:MAG: hypothetical protein J1G01_02610 [Clostridiales bacterium]|nr:hypothetical protein [Clostridiales bacterium]
MANKKTSALKSKVDEIKQKSKAGLNKIKAAKSAPAQNTVTDNKLELLITTVNRSKGEYYIDLLQSFDVNMQFVVYGHGTASKKMLERFGLTTDSDKTVIFSVIQENKLKDALEALDNRFRTIKNGKGIAYTVPFSSVIGTLIFGFLSNNRMAVKENN